MNKKEGRVMYLSEKGFGFIEVEDMKQNIYFHATGVIDTEFESLSIGERVFFSEIVKSDRGTMARVVSIYDR